MLFFIIKLTILKISVIKSCILLKYPDKIIKFKKNLSKVKKSFIRTWKERMDEETVILKKL